MSKELMILMGTAASLGFIHTIFGPDHYLPFIVMSKARQWSIAKTAFITFLCGLGHVLSSVILGFAGILVGVAVFKLEAVEAFRGEIAAWFLLIFGFTYFLWGLRWVIRSRPHKHEHGHDDHTGHEHTHVHIGGHSHVHGKASWASLTPWVLFLIFVFGPCEPLIPLLMYPAAKGNLASVAAVASVFSLVTIATMLLMVLPFSFGLKHLPLGRLSRYSHALAGLAIFLSGAAIKFLGL